MRLPTFFQKALSPAARGNSSWFDWIIKEPFTGAWQRNISWTRKDVLSYPAVFACTTLIASDISKLKVRLQREDQDGIWVSIPYGDFKVIDSPNSYQNRIQFYEAWMLSKLMRGNTYVWKKKKGGKVVELHVLHPDLVLPMVSDNGQVFYQIGTDNLAGIKEGQLTVPATEIIHDRFNCLYHPLVGLSPIYAAGLTAYGGVKMLENSARTFMNGSRPSGVLTVPEAIKQEEATDLAAKWKEKYSGENYGEIAVLGGDVKYQSISMTAEQSEIVAMLGMTDEKICSCYHVPPHKIGLGDTPAYNNVQALNVEYLNSALQRHIEDIELCLKEGLEMKDDVRVNIEEEGLLRMDTKTQIETLAAAVKGGIDTNNEARKARNKKPVDGGDTLWLQQQDYPIEVLAKRRSPDAAAPTPAPEPTEPPQKPDDNEQERMYGIANAFIKGLSNG